MSKLIELSRGLFATVDDEDFEWLSRYTWTATKSDYCSYAMTTTFPGSKYSQMHRVILRAVKGQVVDHRDGNGLNNQRSNLRLCTHAENSHNSRPHKNTSSKFKGVCWNSRVKAWTATISVDGKNRHLGIFKDEESAAKSYDLHAIRFYGDFARLNFPDFDYDSYENPWKPRVKSSMYKHVFLVAKDKKWGFHIQRAGKTHRKLGFPTEEAAFLAKEEILRGVESKQL